MQMKKLKTPLPRIESLEMFPLLLLAVNENIAFLASPAASSSGLLMSVFLFHLTFISFPVLFQYKK